MISVLQLTSLRDVPGFLRAATALRREVASTPGAVRLDLAASPLRRTFWTWSSWTDQTSLDAFVAAPAHRQVMARFHDRLAHSKFLTYDAAEAPASWAQVRERLA